MSTDLKSQFESLMESSSEYKSVSYYNKDFRDELSKLCDIYGSDKGEIRRAGHPYPWPSHTYADFYSKLFSHCRDSVKKVFECGLGTNNPNLPSTMGVSGKPGASLRVWRDYFPNATVYGADIDRDILFQEERIKTYFINQLEPAAIAEFWKATGENDFDFMLDDGLHTFEAGSTLFSNSINYLSSAGIYIIEDVLPSDVLRYVEFFRATDYVVEFISLYRPDLALGDNNLVVVRKHR